MGELHAGVRVAARNSIGQFARECELAGQQTLRDAVEDGANFSRTFAPVGHRHDHRTVPLKSSIHTEVRGNVGRWFSVARHALPIEKGARPHTMIGNPTFRFFWEAAGRMWVPGLFGEPDIINHPGNEAQPFLQPALDLVIARATQLARKNYARIR